MSQLRLGCVVLLAVLAAVHGNAWEKENYPNPQLQPELCSPNVRKPSWLCNPDHVMNEQSALLVREKLKLVHEKAKCYCDDCTDRGGYTISVATMQQMEPMYWTLLPTEQVPVNISSRRYARYLRDTWFADESCTDHVIILVSKLDDLVLISPGEFAKAIFPDEKLRSILHKAEHFFNVTDHYQPRLGLEQMIDEIAEIFDALERAQSFILSGYMIAIILGVVALYCTVGFICCRTYASMKKADRQYSAQETPFFFVYLDKKKLKAEEDERLRKQKRKEKRRKKRMEERKKLEEMQAQTSDVDDLGYDPKYDGVKGEEYEMRPYNDQAAPMPYWYGAPRGATASLPSTPLPGRSFNGRASTLGTASVPGSPMPVRGNPLYKPRSYTIQPSPSLGRESTVYPVRPLGSAASGAASEVSIPPSSGSTHNGINDNNNPYVLCFESTI
ncbi:Hypp5935 [Branchiostoma lanceolatum]|uniref:Hypp5935 protein n=1 Tax=Branchiostoma lanceolatum TaxID=7740 RepID=A0A8J9W523_BRALA|nr:Hypp5935 [Branchiostoma lanceolatum]